MENHTYTYLSTPVLLEYPILYDIIARKPYFEVISYYSGHKTLDEDHIYIRVRVLDKRGLLHLDHVPSVVKHYGIGTLFSNEVMIMVKIPEKYKGIALIPRNG